MNGRSDNFAVHAIIGILGACTVLGFLTICALAYQRHPIPALLATLVVNVVTLLCPSPLNQLKRGDDQPAGTPADPVTVQTAAQPLDVTPVPADVHPAAPDSSDL